MPVGNQVVYGAMMVAARCTTIHASASLAYKPGRGHAVFILMPVLDSRINLLFVRFFPRVLEKSTMFIHGDDTVSYTVSTILHSPSQLTAQPAMASNPV